MRGVPQIDPRVALCALDMFAAADTRRFGACAAALVHCTVWEWTREMVAVWVKQLATRLRIVKGTRQYAAEI